MWVFKALLLAFPLVALAAENATATNSTESATTPEPETPIRWPSIIGASCVIAIVVVVMAVFVVIDCVKQFRKKKQAKLDEENGKSQEGKTTKIDKKTKAAYVLVGDGSKEVASEKSEKSGRYKESRREAWEKKREEKSRTERTESSN